MSSHEPKRVRWLVVLILAPLLTFSLGYLLGLAQTRVNNQQNALVNGDEENRPEVTQVLYLSDSSGIKIRFEPEDKETQRALENYLEKFPRASVKGHTFVAK